MISLLDAASNHARKLLAMSYPRDRWFVRLTLRLQNLCRRLVGNPFRTFVHPPAVLEELVTRGGFRRVDRRSTAVWCIDVYARPAEV